MDAKGTDPAKTGRGSDQFVVRMPIGLRGELKDKAAVNRRSMNAEIVSRLERSLQGEKGGAQ